MRIFALRAALLAVASSTAGYAAGQPLPPSPPDRRETVAGWRVVHVSDEDDGRDVGMRITRGGIRIEYLANYWRGNGTPYRRVSIARSGASCAGEEWQDPPAAHTFPPEPDVATDGRRLRDRLIGYLAECGASAARADQLLEGFAPAFARLAAFAEQARRHINAVNCSISNYPEGEAEVRRRCHRQ